MSQFEKEKRPLCIAFVTPEFITETYFSGGLANYLFRISKALVSRGHTIHVVTSSPINNSSFKYEGIMVHRVQPGRVYKAIQKVSGNFLPTVATWIDFSTYAFFALRRINSYNPLDLVQFPNYSFCGLISTLFLSVPFVVRISSYRPLLNVLAGVPPSIDAKMNEALENLQLRLARYIFAPSHLLQRIFADQGIKVKVIRTPIYLEEEKWEPSIFNNLLADKAYLLFFGRLQLHKGIHILIQALPLFLQTYPDAFAVFVGEDMPSSFGPSMQIYAHSICGDLVNRMIFINAQPHKELYPIVTGARLVVLPSLIENLSNACLEAMTLGKPVLGTLGTSFDEIIEDEKTGFLVPPGDVKSLADKIISSWNHPQLQEIGASAQKKSVEFSISHTIKELENYYYYVLNNKIKNEQ